MCSCYRIPLRFQIRVMQTRLSLEGTNCFVSYARDNSTLTRMFLFSSEWLSAFLVCTTFGLCSRFEKSLCIMRLQVARFRISRKIWLNICSTMLKLWRFSNAENPFMPKKKHRRNNNDKIYFSIFKYVKTGQPHLWRVGGIKTVVLACTKINSCYPHRF